MAARTKAGRGEPNAPPCSGEADGEGRRRAGRRGRHAGCPSQVDTPAAPTEGTQAAPNRGRAGRTGAGASASANARDIAGGWLAFGPHNAGRMQAAQWGTHENVRTDR